MNFREERTAHREKVDAIRAEYEELVTERARYLRDHPEERDPGIAEQCYQAIAFKMSLELGSEEAAALWIDKVNDGFLLSWDEINSVPVPERGAVYYKSRAAVSAICERQARIETGWALAVVEAGRAGAKPMRSYSAATLKAEAKLGEKGQALG